MLIPLLELIFFRLKILLKYSWIIFTSIVKAAGLLKWDWWGWSNLFEKDITLEDLDELEQHFLDFSIKEIIVEYNLGITKNAEVLPVVIHRCDKQD